jgi:predicted nucleotidyltransferase
MATLRERLQAQLTAKEASLEIAMATYNKLLENDILEYNFGAADSHQRARRVDVEKIKRQVNALESEIEALYRRLDGYGLVSINLRRKL